MAGNFSNGGVDTFDPLKRFIGIRLMSAVPLLDRDWNELEDIRRYYESMLRMHYVGTGVPDADSFRITAPTFAVEDDVLIAPGRGSVEGYDVESFEAVLFSEQGDRVPLPAARPDHPTDTVALYLEPFVTRVDGAIDPDLRNDQDIAIETCLRDRLDWAVKAAPPGAEPPPGTLPLAVVTRRPDVARVAAADIADTRRTHLNLADTLDQMRTFDGRIARMETTVDDVRSTVNDLQHDINELFWEVKPVLNEVSALYGDTVLLSVKVTNLNRDPVPGARLVISTSFGTLPTPVVTTGNDGIAVFRVIGVSEAAPFKPSDTAVLEGITSKLSVATVKNSAAIQYAKVAFAPDELAMVSRLTPSAHLADVAREIPNISLVSPPGVRTAVITVNATEGGSVVRAVGTIQVHFGFWVRDWVRDKLRDVVDRVKVDARVSDALRKAVRPGQAQLDLVSLTQQDLPRIFDDVNATTSQALKMSLFDDGDLDDDDLAGSGTIGQLVAQEATAIIGAAANRTIADQVARFEESDDLPDFGVTEAKQAKTQLTQATSQLAAGISQSHKQLFSLPRGL